MEINKRFTLGLIMYLPAAAIAIELTAKLRGYTPIQSDTQTSNNIFYGILGNCSATALKNKSSSIEPAILDSLHCIKSPIKYVLNTKPNYKTSHNSQEFKTETISDDLGLRLPNGKINSDIAMFGDSFTNGHGVEGDERFSWIVQNKCNTPVFNASYANGFSLEHYDYFIQHNTWLKPKVAIINLFASNDLGSDLNETLIDSKDLGTMSLPGRAISKSGNLISYLNIQNFPAKYALALAQHSSAARWLLEKIKAYQYKKASIPAANQQRSTNLSRDGILSSDARSRAVDSLLSISQNLLSRQEKSMVIVAMIPDSLTDLDANRMRASSKNIIAQLQHDINKKKPSNNISFVDMANHLDKSHFFKLDRHYNTLGHKTHAEQISKYLTENSTGACNE